MLGTQTTFSAHYQLSTKLSKNNKYNKRMQSLPPTITDDKGERFDRCALHSMGLFDKCTATKTIITIINQPITHRKYSQSF